MCNFCNIKPTIIDGSVLRVKKTNINLKYQFQQLEQLFKKLINYLKQMINRKDKEKIYSEVVGDMYNNQIINEKTFDNILGYGK